MFIIQKTCQLSSADTANVYYRYSIIDTTEYGKYIQEEPANCILIHMIDNVILWSWKDLAISLHSSVVSFTLPRLGISNVYYISIC